MWIAMVVSLTAALSVASILVEVHWFHRPFGAEVARRWFVFWAVGMHLVPKTSPLWRQRLVFRDALREDPALAREYAELKLELAERFRFDREAYTDAKTPFVARVLAGRCS